MSESQHILGQPFVISQPSSQEHLELFQRCNAVAQDQGWTVAHVANLICVGAGCSRPQAAEIAKAMLNIDNSTPARNEDSTRQVVQSLADLGQHFTAAVQSVFAAIAREDPEVLPLLQKYRGTHDFDGDDKPVDETGE